MPKRTFPRARHTGAEAALGLSGPKNARPAIQPAPQALSMHYPGVRAQVSRRRQLRIARHNRRDCQPPPLTRACSRQFTKRSPAALIIPAAAASLGVPARWAARQSAERGFFAEDERARAKRDATRIVLPGIQRVELGTQRAPTRGAPVARHSAVATRPMGERGFGRSERAVVGAPASPSRLPATSPIKLVDNYRTWGGEIGRFSGRAQPL